MAVPPPSSLTDTAPDKAALRLRLRAARSAFVSGLGADGVAEAQDEIRRRLTPLMAGQPQPAGVPPDEALAGYVAHRGEPDVLPVLRDARAAGRRVALPHISSTGVMTFADWHPDAALATGALGIRQPPAPGTIEPAILLVPLLGFDRRGTRLGQGGGHYDRWLAAHPAARRIGIAWSVQEVDALPVDPWDMPLHAIVTEREWIDP